MKKGQLSTLLLILVLIAGLSLLLYPSFSDFWNSRVQSRAIASYEDNVATLNDEDYSSKWQDAKVHNTSLTQRSNSYVLSEQQQETYRNALNLTGNGIMGYVEVPSIDCKLPIYHGTEEAVLQVAVGHLEWTSLPTGGMNTHCVISGHRGLPSARLFTDLDQLREGDLFMLHVLDELLTYEVDQILIVEPQDTEALLIQQGKDLCTLVTCTPYGINTHRLLVRGHRVENVEEAVVVRVTADAMQIEPLIVASVILVPMLLGLLAVVFLIDAIRKRMRK